MHESYRTDPYCLTNTDALAHIRISLEYDTLMNGPIEGTPTVLQKHTRTHIHKTNNLIWRRKNGLLHQSDPSKQLCFIFDLIVSPLTATFINSSNGQSEVGRVSALILSPLLSSPNTIGLCFTLSKCFCLMDTQR